MSRHLGRAHIIYFSELERWTPLRNAIEQGDEAASWSPVAIGDLVTQVESRVLVQPDAEYGMAGVKWYAEGVFHRETVFGRDMSAKYVTPLKTGALIYNRLFAWKESFAVVQPEHEGLFVSNEFPQFEVNASKALPEFLYLFCTIPATIKQVNAASAGSAAVSRNRLKEAEFLKFKLRLPPLVTQRAIVDHWQAAQKKNAAALLAAEEHEAEVEKQLFRQLGYSTLSVKPKKKAFAVTWGDLDRWSVEFHQQRGISHNPTTGKYPVLGLGDIAVVSYGIQKAPSNRPGSHPHPYLRVANVQRGALDLAVIKYINVPPNELHRFVLTPGDLLVCEGNSAELVGRPAIWNGEIEDCVHQNHLLRVRANREVVLPEYLLHWMNLPIARAHFRSRAKATTNLSSINSSDLRELPVALPPLSIQKQLVADVTAARAKIAAERAAAAKLAADTAREVEDMILGHRPVPNAT